MTSQAPEIVWELHSSIWTCRHGQGINQPSATAVNHIVIVIAISLQQIAMNLHGPVASVFVTVP